MCGRVRRAARASIVDRSIARFRFARPIVGAGFEARSTTDRGNHGRPPKARAGQNAITHSKLIGLTNVEYTGNSWGRFSGFNFGSALSGIPQRVSYVFSIRQADELEMRDYVLSSLRVRDRSRDRRPPSPSRSMPIDGAIDAIDRARSTPFDAFRATRSIDASRFARDRWRTRAASVAHTTTRRRATTRDARAATRDARRDGRRARDGSVDDRERGARARGDDEGGRRRGRAGGARDARRRRASRGGVLNDATTRRWVAIVVFDVRASRVGRTEDGLDGGGATRARAAAARRGDGGGAETDAARRSSVDARVVECSREAFLSVSCAFARRLTGFGDVVVARRRALGPIRRERCGVAPTSRNTSRR